MRKEGNDTERKKIKFQLSFGNYKILENDNANTKFYHELAFVFKSALNEFLMPICPYDVFDEHLMTKVEDFKNGN
jgi:hypothetical protein